MAKPKLGAFAKRVAAARKKAPTIIEVPVASKPKLGAFAKRFARKRNAVSNVINLKDRPIPVGGHMVSALPPIQRKKFQRK